MLMAAHTWTGGGSNGDWSNPSNWSGGVPSASETNVSLDFPDGVSNSNTTNDISGLTVSAMSFEGGYNILGNGFTLSGTISTSASGNPAFAANIALGNNSTLDLNGQMNYYGTISGAYSLTLIGGGALFQEGNNDYTGATIVSNGLIVVDSDTPLGSVSPVTLDANGTLLMDSGIVQDVASLNGSGTITGTGSLIDQTSGYDTFSGQIIDSAELALSGTGRLTVSATGSTTGQVALAAGFLIYDGDLPDASLVQIGGELAGTGTAARLTANGGSMEPGDYSPGALTAGALNLESGSWVDWVAASGSSYESYVATTSVTLGGNFGINYAYAPATGTVFTLIKNESGSPVSGIFQGMPQGSIFQYNNANWQISYTGGGEHDVTLTYLGIPTTTALATEASPAAFGQTVLNATVTPGTSSGAITGTVTFQDGSTVLGTADVGSGGVATFDVTGLSPGDYSITATYNGDSTYEASAPSSAVSQTITLAPTTLSVTPSSTSITSGAAVSLTATVAQTDSAQQPTGNVVFFDNSTNIGTAPIDNTGHATLQNIVLPAGIDSITASYAGDSDFNNSATNTPASVNVLTPISISSPTLTKGSSGTSNAIFTVTLGAASNAIVSFDYTTQDGSAVTGRDYTATSSTLAFAPGQTSKTISVPVIGGMDWQPDRSFSLALSSLTNAVGPNAPVTATIQSTDEMAIDGTVPDELDPSQSDLVIDAPAGNDLIQLKPTKVAGQVQVVINRHVVATNSGIDRVIIYGGSGNNTLTVAPKLSEGVIFFGGAGRNVVTGGNANDILVGGNGGLNTLHGGGGANLLIGGTGPAHLSGSASGDVLIGGSTPYDAGTLSDIQNLEGLLQTWTDGSSYANRVSELANGTSLDGATLSDSNVALVTGDKATGHANRDLILVAAPVKPAKK